MEGVEEEEREVGYTCIGSGRWVEACGRKWRTRKGKEEVTDECSTVEEEGRKRKGLKACCKREQTEIEDGNSGCVGSREGEGKRERRREREMPRAEEGREEERRKTRTHKEQLERIG